MKQTPAQLYLDLSGVRSRKELSDLLTTRLRSELPFSGITILLLNEDDGAYRVFGQCPSEPGMLSRNCSGGDRLLDQLNVAGTVVTWELKALLNDEPLPEWLTPINLPAVRWLIGVSLRVEKKQSACLFFTSKDAFTLEEDLVYQLGLAVFNILAQEELQAWENERSTLLGFSEAITAILDKNDLPGTIHAWLKRSFYYCHLEIMLTDAVQRSYRCFIPDSRSKPRMLADYQRLSSTLYSTDDPVMQLVNSSKGPLLLDLELLRDKPRIPEWVRLNLAGGMRELVVTRLNIGGRPLGLFLLFSDRKGQIDARHLRLIQGVSSSLAIGISHLVAAEELQARENEKSILLAISNDIARVRHKVDLHEILNERLRKLLPISHTLTGLVSEDGQWYSAFLLDSGSASLHHPDYIAVTTSRYPVADGIMDVVLASDHPVVFNLEELVRRPKVPRYLRMNYDSGMREVVFCALQDGENRKAVLVIFAARHFCTGSEHVALIKGIASQMSTAIANILANEKIERQLEEINRYKQQLEMEKRYLQEEIQTVHNSGEIIGTSPAMRDVFQGVSQVANTSSSVLLLGETGTGKELIARAIHNGSPRREKTMVKVNCAALPASLIESELFGHERGSFTGAMERRIGKFELANNSTLFLDEIGELPLELQAKLLRALQEKEIERVGGRGVIKVDVRIIAATNRDLHKEIQGGNFRADLYYRLNVFPIIIPPLRDRREDIASLAVHFLQKHARKGKGAMTFSSKVLKELMAYSWPGNARELEHLVERSMLMAAGSTIMNVLLPGLEGDEMKKILPDAYIPTIDEVEREHIISVLRRCNGKVAGVGGAAQKLRIPSTTLSSKIRRLNIRKGYLNE
jgi:formate hydrogenlyase transcriptional activator